MNKNKDAVQKKVGSLFFFELRTPRDMLEKTRREYVRLAERLHVDNVFNFFVTAYHISDYINQNSDISQDIKDALKQFMKDPDIQDSQDLCNKGKHLILDKGKNFNPSTHIWNSAIGMAPIGILPLGGGCKWVVYLPSDREAEEKMNSREVEVTSLAKRVIEKWDDFFTEHGL